MPNSLKPASNSPGPTTSSVISSVGYLGVGFVVLFAIAFLSALFFVRESIRDTRGILNQDLEGTVERYNHPRTLGPRVGDSPASERRELQVD